MTCLLEHNIGLSHYYHDLSISISNMEHYDSLYIMMCSVMFTYTLHKYVVRAYFLVDFNVMNLLYAMYAISLPQCKFM